MAGCFSCFRLNPKTGVGEHTSTLRSTATEDGRPGVWLDAPRVRHFCARQFVASSGLLGAPDVFREGAENRTRGACTPRFNFGFIATPTTNSSIVLCHPTAGLQPLAGIMQSKRLLTTDRHGFTQINKRIRGTEHGRQKVNRRKGISPAISPFHPCPFVFIRGCFTALLRFSL